MHSTFAPASSLAGLKRERDEQRWFMLLALIDLHPCVALLPCHPQRTKTASKSLPPALCTIGDHLRRRRLDLGLLQREVAERFGANQCSVTNWELGRTKPALRFLPAIVRFLGYVPFPPGETLAERLTTARKARGLSATLPPECWGWIRARSGGGRVTDASRAAASWRESGHSSISLLDRLGLG
jgi:transcriptional regulator with XRE-family HTH domain